MGAIDPRLKLHQRTIRPAVGPLLAGACSFVVGPAVSRLLYEGLFPQWGWVGQMGVAVALGLVAAVAGAFVARRWGLRPALFIPWLLNWAWLLDPVVDPARGRFLFGAGVWAAAALLAWARLGERDERWKWLGPLFVAGGLLPVYLLTMSHAVGAADTFEFQVVAPQLGIAHPTGYPLYLLLGKLASLLPVGTVAWRLNFASAVYAVLAAAVVFRLALRLTRHPLPALAGAVALGLVPIYWGQAIIAEVYTLHALIVASALWLMTRLVAGGDRPQPTADNRRPSAAERKVMVALAFVLGLGLANHLTTVFLLPPAALAIAFVLWPTLTRRGRTAGGRVVRRRSLLPLLLQLALAFAAPLLLYAYLPLRWAAINHEPMGVGRFVDWVVAGRFQGALQWGAWLRDPARREIVGRLLLDAWGWPHLALAVAGLVWLLRRHWRVAAVLLLAGAGFTFYALNYYVPDLAVFLIPTHVVVGVCAAAGVGIPFAEGWTARRYPTAWSSLLFVVALLPALLPAGGRWAAMDQSGRDGGETWARGVLAMPLARGAAVLADSEKIAPLYYVQQMERLRPDLEIMVLPDEAAYRAELDARLAAGQPVYLARYLPGLEGVYHLRSAGPLVAVSREPLDAAPDGMTPSELVAGPLRLLGYTADAVSPFDPAAASLTLYWTLDRPLADGELPPALYLRWAGDGAAVGRPPVSGLLPASDTYPVNAWRPGEIVVDHHLLPLPDVACPAACPLDVEVAVAPRFAPPESLEWQRVTTLSVAPRPGPVGSPRRAFFGGFALDGLDVPSTIRPGTPLPVRYSGYADGAGPEFLFVPTHATSSFVFPSTRPAERRVAASASVARAVEMDAATETGPHVLIALATGESGAVCGWPARPSTGCVLARVEVSGAPLPQGAANFDDQLALLDITVDESAFVPGGLLPLTLTWQGLAPMSEDYTVFVQVLDAADRIVGQVDAWPVQGTRPTSSWRPGEAVVDPHLVQLSADMPPGEYRLITGLYLLATGRRLPVVDEAGSPTADRVELLLRLD